MTIAYYENLLPLAGLSELDDIETLFARHFDVNELIKGKGETANRDYQYSLKKTAEGLAVRLRTPSPISIDSVNEVKHIHSFEAGDLLSLTFAMAIVKRNNHSPIVKEVIESDLDDWITPKLNNKGMEPISIAYSDTAHVKVNGKGRAKRFMFPTRRFWVDVKITDKDQFYDAMQYGIGLRKSYGMGMIDIEDAA